MGKKKKKRCRSTKEKSLASVIPFTANPSPSGELYVNKAPKLEFAPRPKYPVAGGASGDIPADDHIRGILAELNFNTFGPLTAISYTKQVVAGTNYVIKASAPGGVTVTLNAFKPLGGAPARVTSSSAVC